MNYFVSKLQAKVKDVPEIDETFLYGAFTTIAGAKKTTTIAKFGEALNDYEHLPV
jgi:hypothetical protein